MKRSSAQKEREALVRKQWKSTRKTSTSANCGSREQEADRESGFL